MLLWDMVLIVSVRLVEDENWRQSKCSASTFLGFLGFYYYDIKICSYHNFRSMFLLYFNFQLSNKHVFSDITYSFSYT